MPHVFDRSAVPQSALVIPELLSVDATAGLLSVSAKTVQRMVADGRLDRVRIGRRVLVTRRSVDLLLGRPA